MTGCDPAAVVSRFDRLGNVGKPDLQECGRCGGGLVPELADRAVLVGRVLLVADGRNDRDAGQRDRQGDDPGAPPSAMACDARVHESGHWLSTLAEIARGDKGRWQSANAAPVASDCTGALDSGSPFPLE